MAALTLLVLASSCQLVLPLLLAACSKLQHYGLLLLFSNIQSGKDTPGATAAEVGGGTAKRAVTRSSSAAPQPGDPALSKASSFPAPKKTKMGFRVWDPPGFSPRFVLFVPTRTLRGDRANAGQQRTKGLRLLINGAANESRPLSANPCLPPGLLPGRVHPPARERAVRRGRARERAVRRTDLAAASPALPER